MEISFSNNVLRISSVGEIFVRIEFSEDEADDLRRAIGGESRDLSDLESAIGELRSKLEDTQSDISSALEDAQSKIEDAQSAAGCHSNAADALAALEQAFSEIND